MRPHPLTPEDFDQALTALAWKGSDFCDRAGLVANTVWRWRKGIVPIPLWVGEYLRAMLAIQRLQADFLAPRRATEAEAATALPVLDSEDAGAA
jgi:hypothetical protein